MSSLACTPQKFLFGTHPGKPNQKPANSQIGSQKQCTFFWIRGAVPGKPKGSSRTVFSTESVVFYYSIVNLLHTVIHYSKYSKSLQNVVIHYIVSSESLCVVNSLEIVKSLRELFFLCRGPLGRNARRIHKTSVLSRTCISFVSSLLFQWKHLEFRNVLCFCELAISWHGLPAQIPTHVFLRILFSFFCALSTPAFPSRQFSSPKSPFLGPQIYSFQ